MQENLLDKPFLTIKETAELARVSVRTVHLWIKKGQVEFLRNAGGMKRVKTSTIFKTNVPEAKSARQYQKSEEAIAREPELQ